MDDRLARVYARSARVKKELPDYHEALRTAVGVARAVQVGVVCLADGSRGAVGGFRTMTTTIALKTKPQDPLALVASIYAAQDPRGGRYGGPGYQLAFLHLHELQVCWMVGCRAPSCRVACRVCRLMDGRDYVCASLPISHPPTPSIHPSLSNHHRTTGPSEPARAVAAAGGGASGRRQRRGRRSQQGGACAPTNKCRRARAIPLAYHPIHLTPSLSQHHTR